MTRHSPILLADRSRLAALAADLTHATVVAPATLTGPERKAVSLLIDSVRERTRITWPVGRRIPGPASRLSLSGAPRRHPTAGGRISPAHLRQRRGARRGDRRATTSAASCSASAACCARSKCAATRSPCLARSNIQTAPKYALARPPVGLPSQDQLLRRLGRARCGNSYIRDLAVFGANAIELIPPRSDDAADSPHFPLAAHADDGRDVAPRAGVRPGVLDLVSGHGPGLLESRHRGGRAPGMGRGLPPASPHRRRLRPRRRPRPHRAAAT